MSKISILFDKLIEYSQRQNEPLFRELQEELIKTSSIGQETLVLIKTLEVLNGIKSNIGFFIKEFQERIKSNKKIQKPPKKAMEKLRKERKELGV